MNQFLKKKSCQLTILLKKGSLNRFFNSQLLDRCHSNCDAVGAVAVQVQRCPSPDERTDFFFFSGSVDRGALMYIKNDYNSSTVWRRLKAPRRCPRPRGQVVLGRWWRGQRRRRRPRQEGEVDRDEEDVALHGRRRQAAHSRRAAQGRIRTQKMFQFRPLRLRVSWLVSLVNGMATRTC